MMKKKICFLLPLLFCLLYFSGCSLPVPVDSRPALSIETEPASIPETMQASKTMPEPTWTSTPLPTLTPTATETPEPTMTFGPSPTPTLGPGYFHGSLWYTPEFVSQEGLLYRGRQISTGCTAASVQMVLDFWHAYKEDYPTTSAQKLIDQNGWQGQFDPATGLNIMNTEDDLREMDYYLGVRQDSDKEELLTALERYGPLLILTKVEWTPFGANHMAVLTGYDPERDLIRVLDPWQYGGIMEFPYENFDGIWSLNYLDDLTETLQRSFFFIVPYRELSPENSPFVPSYILNEITR